MKKVSADLELELNRETDLLRHYTSAAKENLKESAKKAADFALSLL